MTVGKPTPARFVADRRYAKPEAAGRRLMHHAREAKRLQSGDPDRIYIEQVNTPFLFKDGGTPTEYSAGMAWLIAESCIEMDDSGFFCTLHPKARTCSRRRDALESPLPSANSRPGREAPQDAR